MIHITNRKDARYIRRRLEGLIVSLDHMTQLFLDKKEPPTYEDIGELLDDLTDDVQQLAHRTDELKQAERAKELDSERPDWEPDRRKFAVHPLDKDNER